MDDLLYIQAFLDYTSPQNYIYSAFALLSTSMFSLLSFAVVLFIIAYLVTDLEHCIYVNLSCIYS